MRNIGVDPTDPLGWVLTFAEFGTLRSRLSVRNHRSLELVVGTGAATAEAMRHLGLENVGRVRVGKSIEIELPDGAKEETLHQIARDLLSNPVIEDYTVAISQ